MDEIDILEHKFHSLQQEVVRIAQELGKYKSDSLSVCTDEKGRGVRSRRPIKKGDILCSYDGELITHSEGTRRSETSCFLFFFKFKEKSFCIDATNENCTFGRLINHSRKKANVKPVACDVGGKPGIVFQAKVDIAENTEILYDYGERRKAEISLNPWLRE